MKIFQVLKKNLAVFGFIPNQQQNNHWKLNVRQKVSLIWHFITLFSYIVFILVDASGIEDNVSAISASTLGTAVFMSFISIIYKNDEIFNVIENFEYELLLRESCLILIRSRKIDHVATDNFFLLHFHCPLVLAGSSIDAKSCEMYEKTVRFVEKLSETMYVVMIKLLLPTLLLPKAILSYFIYFTTDAGSAAFQLPLPTW